MRKSLLTIFALCLPATLFFGCHKHDALKTQSTYTFTNATGKRVTFDIYASEEDYYGNTKRTQQYLIEAGANQQIVFDVSKSYWVDWYTANYSFNNWQSPYYAVSSNRPTPGSKITIAAEDDNYRISSGIADTARSVLLNGNGLSSTWMATISSSGGGVPNGSHKFVFRKNFLGEYTYTAPGGDAGTIPFRYGYISSTSSGIVQSFTLTMLNNQANNSMFQATCNIGTSFSPHTGRDTMLIRFLESGSSTTYPAVRQ